MNLPIVIIGGGVAGLCSAIELQKMGYQAHVIEAGNYPAHKVCGEFISSESVALLNTWNIDTIPIHQASFHAGEKSFRMPFLNHAGGLSHYSLDPQLVKKALALGATVQTDTKVEAFAPKLSPVDYHLIHLSTGEVLKARIVIMATGRLPTLPRQPSQASFTAKYLGFKAHFNGIPINNSLEMFLGNGAYLGISPIEGGKVNIACLAQADQSVDQVLDQISRENPKLREYLHSGTNLFGKWMETSVPDFGFRKVPDWQDTYFIGDACMTIPPACGGGVSLAITGGIKAARAIPKGDSIAFQKNQVRQHRIQMWVAQGLHTVVMKPVFANAALSTCSFCPALADQLYAFTRQL